MMAIDHDPALSLMTRFGGAASHVLTDPSCKRFTIPALDGVIAYRESPGCRVAIGDPVCHPDTVDDLAEEFRLACARDGRNVAYAASSEAFASRCAARGYVAIEFGEEIVLDPREDRLSGSAGRELRKKVRRAEREGVLVREHEGADGVVIETAMQGVAREWLAARRGPQAFIVPIAGFEPTPAKRWFYAMVGRRMIGVLSLVRMDAKTGWGIEHLLHSPDGPVGASELLVTHALRVIGEEGATHATFGPAPLARLGRMHGVGRLRAEAARLLFDMAERLLGNGAILRFREKFGVARREPSFLLYHPRMDVLTTYGLFRAFSAH